jgi:uncharacterized protein (DUF2252 family)
MKDSLENPTSNERANKVLADLRSWNKDIHNKDRQSKYCRMAAAPLVFYRGTNHLFWADIAEDKRLCCFGNEKTKTWLQGDLHVYNFGSYGNSRGEVVYDLNDFDEAVIADYQYDLWRMAVSIVLVARQNDDLSIGQQKKVIDTFSQSYLDTMELHRKKKKAGQGYSTKHNTFGKLQYFLGSVEQQYSSEGMLDRWAPRKKGKRRFDLSRAQLDKVAKKECKMILEAVLAYRRTLDKDLAKNDAYFKVEDVARRLLAGTGSLGTNRYYVLIAGGKGGNSNQYHILDIKRQSKPTAYTYLGDQAQRKYDESFKNDAQRHAKGYQALTRRTDKHLGWMHLDSGDPDFPSGYYSVRKRSPFKEAFPGEALDTRTSFSAMAEQWAEILAAAHTHANKDLPQLVHQLTDDRDETFRSLVREIAFGYADQVMTDWQYFVTALDLAPDECRGQGFVPPSYRDILPR